MVQPDTWDTSTRRKRAARGSMWQVKDEPDAARMEGIVSVAEARQYLTFSSISLMQRKGGERKMKE